MHGDVVATAESFAVVVTQSAIHVRMAVLLVVVRVGMAVVGEVPASSIDAVMKTLALHVVEFSGRLIPPTPNLNR
jgi:hypothetical protein